MTEPRRTADLHPPEDVLRITRRLEDAGFATWAVGGAVRDTLASTEPGDWDLTTSARPADMRRLFRRTVPLGIEHGTVGVIGRSGKMYEVTTFRRDVETFGRKARVAFADRLEDDLARRDFTMNAVAWHPLTREVRDPHGGMNDLARGVLRTVGDPGLRFAEDRLRVLRALRFAGGFALEIDADTWQALLACAGELGNLSAERIREELWKVLAGQPQPSRTLRLYAASGVLAALYPELDACRGVSAGEPQTDLWEHLVRSADAVPRSRPRLRLAALLHDIGKVPFPIAATPEAERARATAGAGVARRLLSRLRSSNADRDAITHLVAQYAPLPTADVADPELRRWIRRIGPDHLNDLFRLLFADCRARPSEASLAGRLRLLYARTSSIRRARPPLEISDLAIGGNDLRDHDIPPGPRYGEILSELLERVTDDPGLNRREILLEIVEEMKGD